MEEDSVRDSIIRKAVKQRMMESSHMRAGSHADYNPYSVQMDPNRMQPRPDKSPYHPIQNPFPPPDPEWVAGKGREEMLVSIFVYHPESENSLWDNPLFISQALELLVTLIFGVIALLVMTDWIAINNYIFIIAFSVIYFVLIMIHFLSVWYWAKQPRFSHKHNNEIQFPFFFWIVLYGITILIIGRWLDTVPGSCCSFVDSQPDKTDLPSYNLFVSAYTVLTVVSAFLVYPLSRALLSHYYPEGRYVPSFDNTRSTDIYIDEIDEPDELKVLTSAPARSSGKASSGSNYGQSAGHIPRGVRRDMNTNMPKSGEYYRGQSTASVVFPNAHGNGVRQPRHGNM